MVHFIVGMFIGALIGMMITVITVAIGLSEKKAMQLTNDDK